MAELAGEVRDNEENVAQLGLDGLWRGAFGERRLHLADLLLQLGEDAGVAVEADAGGALLKLQGAGQGGEGAGNVVEDALGWPGRFRRALGGLDDLPVDRLFGGGAGGCAGESMGVAADHLGLDRRDHVGEGVTTTKGWAAEGIAFCSPP